MGNGGFRRGEKMNIVLRVKQEMLSCVDYNFTPLALERISASMENKIEIKEIKDNEAELKVCRILNFGPGTDSYISVTYLVNVIFTNSMDSKQLADTIVENYKDLTSVFAKISYVISQLTSACPLGVLVTPPSCHPSNTEVIY